ncbi:MAG: peroxiredoxin-like family protein [Mariprofundaceae bacterium]|nr:peroxiredoxin-like family protein [Mariprofundaceae bacterium]
MSNMSLSEALEELNRSFAAQVPEGVVTEMASSTELLRQSGLADHAVQAGQSAPDFDLPELGGNRVSLSEEVKNGPVVISFYRGAWCPYCNLEMQALQRALPEIEAAGGKLIAIAPELPEHAGQIRDKGNLTFPLLNDRDNSVARECGLVFTLPASLRPVYEGFGIDLVSSQGNDRFELPIPATYIVDRDGVVAHAFVDVDYTKRMEPSEIIEVLKKL